MKDIRLPATAGSIIKASKRVTDSARHGAGLAAKSAREKAVALSNLSQGVLASALSVDLNSAMASLAKGPATIYDKAMDTKYLATSIGGGNHRLFDGGHTLSGAFTGRTRSIGRMTLLPRWHSAICRAYSGTSRPRKGYRSRTGTRQLMTRRAPS